MDRADGPHLMVWDTIPPPPPKGTKPRADGTWWCEQYERDNPGACAMVRRAIAIERRSAQRPADKWPGRNFYDLLADAVLWTFAGLFALAGLAALVGLM